MNKSFFNKIKLIDYISLFRIHETAHANRCNSPPDKSSILRLRILFRSGNYYNLLEHSKQFLCESKI
jgi:hypothetical protein